VIRTKLLPNLTGQCAFNDIECELLSLPPRLGGLGIINMHLSNLLVLLLLWWILFYNNLQSTLMMFWSAKQQPSTVFIRFAQSAFRYHPSYNFLFCFLVKTAYLAGLLPFPYQIMAMLYIKEPFVMPFVFVMVGSPLHCLQVVFAGNQ